MSEFEGNAISIEGRSCQFPWLIIICDLSVGFNYRFH